MTGLHFSATCLRVTETDSCLVSVGLSVWAKVEVTMDDSVEVYLGDLAQISCQYSFTHAGAEPSDVIIQWFVVSTAGPAAKTDTARLVPSKRRCSRGEDGSALAFPAWSSTEVNGTNASTAVVRMQIKPLQLGTDSEGTLLWTEPLFSLACRR